MSASPNTQRARRWSGRERPTTSWAKRRGGNSRSSRASPPDESRTVDPGNSMRISIHGAAGGEVTGSAYLVQTRAARVLVDFGLFQGSRTIEQQNRLPD